MGLLISHVIFAQTKQYSLEEVWQKTLQHYPTLTSKKQIIEQQELRKELVRKQFLPEVAVQAQQSFGSLQNMPGSFFPLPGIYTTVGTNKNGTIESSGANVYSSAVLQWNFLQFGRMQKKLAVADAAIQVSSKALNQEELQLVSAATRLYFSALHSVALLKILNDDSQRLGDLLGLLKAQSNAGLRPGADTLLLKAALLQSKEKVHEQQGLLNTSLIQLASLMGEEKAKMQLDTSVYHRFNKEGIGSPDDIKNHPYLQWLNARINHAEAEKELIKKDVYPSVGLLAGVGLKGSSINSDGTVNKNFSASWNNASGNYLAGIGLTWNFSSLYQNKTKRAIAEREIAAAKADHEAVKMQLTALHAAALGGWKEQRQRLSYAEASYQSSKEAYELYEVRYQSGLISLIELLQLQKGLQDAEQGYVAAVAAYWNELMNQAQTLGNLSLLLTAIQP